MNILSFGGGVQSTALAILAAEKKIDVDAIVFCDTGFEQTIVFDFLNRFTIPMLHVAKIPFFIAKAEDYAGKYFANLELPPFFNNDGGEVGRSQAFCSSKWKRDVFTRFVNEHYKEKSYDVLMGFSTDEKHRAARMKSIKKWQYKFPLLDLQMNRGDCIALVERKFNAPPPRSSCFYCPNHTRSEWRSVMEGPDRDILIKFDESLRQRGKFLTHDCLPIKEVDFDDKNESIFSRLCSGGCFL
jgi:hypothetical protein